MTAMSYDTVYCATCHCLWCDEIASTTAVKLVLCVYFQQTLFVYFLVSTCVCFSVRCWLQLVQLFFFCRVYRGVSPGLECTSLHYIYWRPLLGKFFTEWCQIPPTHCFRNVVDSGSIHVQYTWSPHGCNHWLPFQISLAERQTGIWLLWRLCP